MEVQLQITLLTYQELQRKLRSELIDESQEAAIVAALVAHVEALEAIVTGE